MPEQQDSTVASATSRQANWSQATVLRKQGRFEEAAKVSAEGLKEREDAAGYLELAAAWVDLGRVKDAETAFRTAIKLEPVSAEAHARLGFLLDDLERDREAREEYARAAELYRTAPPADDAEAFTTYARVLAGLGRRQNAEVAYRRALELLDGAVARRPDDPDLASARGFVLDELGRRAEALKAYDQAVAFRPNDPIARFNRAVVLDNLSLLEKAEAAYRDAIALLPDDPDGYAALGWVLGKLGRYAEAEHTCRKALTLRPDHAEANAALGFALERLGQLSQAESAYRAALSQEPDSAETLSNLAHLLNAMDRPEEAETYARQAIDRKRTWQALGTLASILAELAAKYHDDDLYADAVEEIKEALTLRSGPVLVLSAGVSFGRVTIGPVEVQPMPSRVGESDRDDVARLHLQLANIYGNQGRYAAARTEYRKCLNMAIRNSSVWLRATRNLRRVNDRLRRWPEIPRWVPYGVSGLALLGLGYAVDLVQNGKLQSVGFSSFTLGLLFVIFAAFSLPSITRLKIGPAELEKVAGIPNPPQIDKS